MRETLAALPVEGRERAFLGEDFVVNYKCRATASVGSCQKMNWLRRFGLGHLYEDGVRGATTTTSRGTESVVES